MITGSTLFCEDIREEVGGSATLVGVMPDNIGVPGVPGALPKLGIYTRFAVPSDGEPKAMQVVLRAPDGEESVLGDFAVELVRQSCADAQERGNPIAGFVSTAMAGPFPIKEQGRFLAILRVGRKDLITGSLNFEINGETVQSRSAAT